MSSRAESYQQLRGLERHQEAEKHAFSEEAVAYKSKLDALLEQRNRLVQKKGEERSEAEQKEDELDQLIADLRQELGGEEEVKTLAREARAALWQFMRQRRELLNIREKLDTEVKELIRAVHASAEKESALVWREISRYEAEIAKTDEMIEELARKNPVAFQAHWLLRLREHKRQFEESGIIETPAIRQQTEKLMSDTRRKLEGTNGVVALLGPTGSGKTVLARKLAAAFSPHGEYEFVSGHPKMTAEDLIERLGITVASTPPEKVPEFIALAQERFRAEHPELSGEELKTQLDLIADIVSGREKQKVLESKKILEAVGRAAAEGKIVVIDEFNYLPPDTLAALNDLLSAKPGVKVKKGFGVIFTGNIGKEYLKRQPLDPAFVNRILSGTVEYAFPPQELNAALDESIKSNEELASGEVPLKRDLYQIAVTQLLDKRGNLLAPEQALRQVWDLTRIVSLAQQISAGKDFRDLGLNIPGTQAVTAMKFEQIFLSFRNLNQIVREWKQDGFTKPLDWYVFANVIRPAAVISPKEAAELYYLFGNWGGMFVGDAWKNIQVDSATWKIYGADKVPEIKPKKMSLKHFLPSEVVRAVSGMDLPPFVESEVEGASKTEEEKNESAMADMERAVYTFRQEFEKQPDLEVYCQTAS